MVQGFQVDFWRCLLGTTITVNCFRPTASPGTNVLNFLDADTFQCRNITRIARSCDYSQILERGVLALDEFGIVFTCP